MEKNMLSWTIVIFQLVMDVTIMALDTLGSCIISAACFAHPCVWSSFQGIEEPLPAELGPFAVSPVDVFASWNPLALVGSSIGVMAICKRSPFATDDVAHAPGGLEGVDRLDEPQLGAPKQHEHQREPHVFKSRQIHPPV